MRILLLISFLAITSIGFAQPPKILEEFTAKVISVTDGDTIKVLKGRETITIGLEGIDAPELNQPYGNKSKEALSEMVIGKTVTVKKTGTDSSGRTFAVIETEEVEANGKMIDDGWAWHYKKYNKDIRYALLETSAKESHLGLWVDKNPVAPWDFRAKEAAKKDKGK